MDADTSAYHEVTAVLHRLGRAIADNDADAVLATFWSSDDVVMLGSEEAETAYGRAALERLWGRILSRGQRYTWRWQDEKVARAGSVAWVSATAVVTIADARGSRDVPYRATLVVLHDDGQWVIAQYHGSEPGRAW